MFDRFFSDGKARDNSKDIYLRIGAGTELWQAIRSVNETMPDYLPTKVARVLIRAGYHAFLRAEELRNDERD